MIKTGEAEEDQKVKGCPYLFSDKGKKKEGKDDSENYVPNFICHKIIEMRNQISNGKINILLRRR